MGGGLEIGTFAHEDGHMLCGYPDLYDYTYDSVGVGSWCLMGYGSGGGGGNNPAQISAYLKNVSGWATIIDITAASSVFGTVKSQPGSDFNTFYRYLKPGTSTEYFIIEARAKTNHDASLPGTGVAVWHIDELGNNSSVNLNPNSVHNNFEATLVQADGKWDLEKGKNYGESQDLYYQGNAASGYSNVLSDTTSPHSHWWNGSPSGLVLRQFSTSGHVMTFIGGTNDPAPAIVSQPRGLTVIQGQSAAFSVAVNGFNPISYQWRNSSGPIAGATTSSYTIASAGLSDAGNYSVVVTNQYGSMTSSNALLTVIPTVPLPYALNNSNVTWTTDAGTFWYGQTNTSKDGIAAAQPVPLADNQQTTLRTTVTGPGTLNFWWKVSSQTNADLLTFRFGGTDQASISGTVDWQQRAYFLPAGALTLEWRYAKNASGSNGLDTAWVDQVAFTSGATSPFFVREPQDQTSLGGTPITFSAQADGTPNLSYQWIRNGQDLPGATGTSLNLASPKTLDIGNYAVRVTSTYGQVTSSNAFLGVVPLAVSGDNSFGQTAVSAYATNVMNVAAGGFHSLALTPQGGVLAWGDNFDGQCNVPPNLTGVILIAAGGYHSLALKSDGTIAGWGDNFEGQLDAPPGLTNVISIAAGYLHSIALKSDRTVVAWGDNSWGQTSVPTGATNVVAIAAGGSHNLALRADGTVVAWGENTDSAGVYTGQSIVPPNTRNIVAIAAGDYHSVALKSDGTVVGWGDNSQGQAQPPGGLSQVRALSAGGAHTLALKANATVTAWGANWNGQCTFSTYATNVTAVAAGNAHTLLLLGVPAVAPSIVKFTHAGGTAAALAQTFPGRLYSMESKTSLADPNWTSSSTVVIGNGAAQWFTDSQATTPQRFYRVREW